MRSLFDAANRTEILGRIARFDNGAKARWGKMNAAQMLVHLMQSLRMAMGELECKPRRLPIRYFPLKQLVIYVAPFPKGAPTAPELIPPADAGTVENNRNELASVVEKFASREADAETWPEHPAFGKLTRQAWGVLTYRHFDHHLRQFGA